MTRSFVWPVSMTVRFHLFPFRTQKLSSLVPKIVGWKRPVKIGRCRLLKTQPPGRANGPARGCLYAPLAQLVEQLTLNQWVLGSSPRWCTKNTATSVAVFFYAPSPSGRAHASRKRLHSPRGERSLKTFHWNVFLTLPLMVHQKQPYTVCRAVFLLQHPGTLRLSRCRRGREQLVPAACSGGHKIERGSLWCLISRKEGLHHPLRGSRMRCANVCVHLA